MNHQALDTLIVLHLVRVLDDVKRLRVVLVPTRAVHPAQVPDLQVTVMSSRNQLQTSVRDTKATDCVTMRRLDALDHGVATIVEHIDAAVLVARADDRAGRVRHHDVNIRCVDVLGRGERCRQDIKEG